MPPKIIKTFLTLLGFTIGFSVLGAAPDPAWIKTSEDNGITVWKKEVPNSDLIAFRGEGIIDAPIAKVASVLMNTPRKAEWVAKIIEVRDLRVIGPLERIQYNHTSSGFFLVKDRDFVFRVKGYPDPGNKRISFKMNSIEDPLMPETDKVRGNLNESSFQLTSIESDKKTNLVVEIHADPRGSVPKWVVNIFQKSWPRKTIEGIRKQVAKPDVGEDADIRKAVFDRAR